MPIVLTGFILLLVLAHRWRNPSVVRQLAAFDAARAVQDKDNAALVYAHLLGNHLEPFSISDLAVIPGESALAEMQRNLGLDEVSLVFEREPQTLSRPWTMADYPATARLLDRYANGRSILREAAQLETCYFLISAVKLSRHAYTDLYDPYGAVSPWEQTYQHILLEAIERYCDLLLSSAYLDMGEGRHADAIDKAWDLIQVGRHLCQFPLERSLCSGTDIESDGLHLLNRMAIKGPSSMLALSDWQENCERANEHWLPTMQQVNEANDLIYQEGRGRIGESRNEATPHAWASYIGTALNHLSPSPSKTVPRPGSQTPVAHGFKRLTSQYRRLRFLAELRRYKTSSGQWPTRLDQIGPSLPTVVLGELQDAAYPLIWFSQDCFVLYGLPSMVGDGKSFGRQELFVCDGRTLGVRDIERVTLHVQHFVDLALRDHLYNYQLGEYFCRMAPYSTPLLIQSLHHTDPVARTTARYCLSFMGKKEKTLLYGHSRAGILELLVSGYPGEEDDKAQKHYMLALLNFSGLSPVAHARLVGFLGNLVSNGPTPDQRGWGAHVLLHLSELDGLLSVLDHMERLTDTRYFSNRQNAVWFESCRVLRPFGFEEYLQERFEGSNSSIIRPHYVEALGQWWQENRERVISALKATPDGDQLTE